MWRVWVGRAGCRGSWWGNWWEGDHWVDLGVDGWIILGWVSRRWDVGIWTGLGSPRIELSEAGVPNSWWHDNIRYLDIKLLEATGHYMYHHQFNIQHCRLCPQCIYVFCNYLRTNSDLCHLLHKLIGFCDREEKCLQRGTAGAMYRAVWAVCLKG